MTTITQQPAVSAGRLGCGRSPAQEGSCPGRRDVPDQTGDRPRSDRDRAGGRRRSVRLAGRRWVWRRRRVPLRRHGQRFGLCGRRAVDAERLAPRRRTAAAQTLERVGPPAISHAPRRRTCPFIPPRRWRGGLPRRLGASFHGERAPTKSCLGASRPCGSGRLPGTGRFRRPTRWNGFSSNGPRVKKSRRNTGFRPCLKTRPSTFSSTRPRTCAGAPQRDTRNSKPSSASPISKGEAGADSIITPPPRVFSSANERRFPLQAPCGAKSLAYPRRPTPRGAANPTRTAYRKFDRHDPKTTHRRAGPNPHARPVSPNLATTAAP